MRLMGLDVGDKTIGVAVSDGMGWTAQGIKTIYRRTLERDFEELARLIMTYDIQKIVVGLPVSLDGGLKVQADKVIRFNVQLKERFELEIVTWDERLSTVAAQRTLHETQSKRSKMKEKINELAAQWILQGYMDREAKIKNSGMPSA